MKASTFTLRDLWTRTDLALADSLGVVLPTHASVLYGAAPLAK